MVTVGQHVYNSLVFLAYSYFSANVPPALEVHPEQGLNIAERIATHGYHFEEHEVQTEDGYLLTLFRLSKEDYGNVTFGKESPRRGPPVLLMHGILSSAQDYIVLGPNVSMAYGLVDSGYDVWLGNARGNTWSRKHVKYHPDEPRFWRFSFHELGYYDLPAKVDHITNVTGYQSINYVGHSQGTTAMFVMASERPEYINKIKMFAALAPVAFPKAMPSMLATMCALFYKQLEWLIYTYEYLELLPHGDMLTDIFRMMSHDGSPYSGMFWSSVYANLGYSKDTDTKLFSLIVSSFPAGASTRQVLHYVQNKLSDSFRKYDHGPLMNMKVYGQWKPPKYTLRTNLPTALIYSLNDWLSTEDDVERISSELKNLKLKYRLPGSYSHTDFLFGKDTTNIILDILKQLLKDD